MEKNKKKKNEKPAGAVQVNLEYVIPDTLPTYSITNAVIQHAEGEFVIGFYNVRRPIILSEQDRVAAKDIKTVKATCSALISVTPERLEKFVGIFQEQLKRYSISAESKQSQEIKQPQEIAIQHQPNGKTNQK